MHAYIIILLLQDRNNNMSTSALKLSIVKYVYVVCRYLCICIYHNTLACIFVQLVYKGTKQAYVAWNDKADIAAKINTIDLLIDRLIN